MDGEHNGKPYVQMDDLGVPLYLETPIYCDIVVNSSELLKNRGCRRMVDGWVGGMEGVAMVHGVGISCNQWNHGKFPSCNSCNSAELKFWETHFFIPPTGNIAMLSSSFDTVDDSNTSPSKMIPEAFKSTNKLPTRHHDANYPTQKQGGKSQLSQIYAPVTSWLRCIYKLFHFGTFFLANLSFLTTFQSPKNLGVPPPP